MEPADAVRPFLRSPGSLVIVLAILAVLVYEAINVLLLLGWVRLRGRPATHQLL